MTKREVCGWVGALTLLIAYGMLSADLIGAGLLYQGLNILGAAGLYVAAMEKRNYPTAALEIAWILIALYGIYKVVAHPVHS